MQYTSFDKKTSDSIAETARQNMKELEDILKQQHALELAQAFARGAKRIEVNVLLKQQQ